MIRVPNHDPISLLSRKRTTQFVLGGRIKVHVPSILRLPKSCVPSPQVISPVPHLRMPDCVTVCAATLSAPPVLIVMFETIICAPGLRDTPWGNDDPYMPLIVSSLVMM